MITKCKLIYLQKENGSNKYEEANRPPKKRGGGGTVSGHYDVHPT